MNKKIMILKKGWKISTVFLTILMLCSFSTAYQIANGNTVNKIIQLSDINDDDLIDKIKNEENIYWEEIYNYLNYRLSSENNNRLYNKWLEQLDYLDENIKLILGNKIDDIFPYYFKIIYKFLGSPDFTEQELLKVIRKISMLNIKMIPAYNFLKRINDQNNLLFESILSYRLPTFIEETAGEVFKDFYPLIPSDNSVFDDDSDIHYEKYRQWWNISFHLRGKKSYTIWNDGVDELTDRYLGITAVLTICCGIISWIGNQSFNAKLFWFLMTAQFIFDTIAVWLVSYIYQIESLLFVWNADIILHVTDNTTKEGISDLGFLAENLNALSDTKEDPTWYTYMHQDGFYGKIDLPEWTISEKAPDKGWYILSLSITNKSDHWYYPPGTWNIEITKLPEIYELPNLSDIDILRGQTYCLNISIDRKPQEIGI